MLKFKNKTRIKKFSKKKKALIIEFFISIIRNWWMTDRSLLEKKKFLYDNNVKNQFIMKCHYSPLLGLLGSLNSKYFIERTIYSLRCIYIFLFSVQFSTKWYINERWERIHTQIRVFIAPSAKYFDFSESMTGL